MALPKCSILEAIICAGLWAVANLTAMFFTTWFKHYLFLRGFMQRKEERREREVFLNFCASRSECNGVEWDF